MLQATYALGVLSCPMSRVGRKCFRSRIRRVVRTHTRRPANSRTIRIAKWDWVSTSRDSWFYHYPHPLSPITYGTRTLGKTPGFTKPVSADMCYLLLEDYSTRTQSRRRPDRHHDPNQGFATHRVLAPSLAEP